MNRAATMLVVYLIAVGGALAGLTPLHRWTCNVEDMPPPPHDLEVRRNEDMIFETQFRQFREGMNLSDALQVIMVYTDQDPAVNTMAYGKTGVVYNAATGYTRIHWSPADCPTNEAYAYELLVIGPTSTLAKAFGQLRIKPAVGDAPVITGTPRVISIIDWANTVYLNQAAYPFTNVTATVTNGVARINSRLVTTNYAVTVTNGVWDGVTAVLQTNGVLTVTAEVPIARWEYEVGQHAGIELADQAQTGSTWFARAHGTLDRADVSAVRIAAGTVEITILDGVNTNVTISNLTVWAWGDASLAGTSNDMAGIRTYVDDPVEDLEAVNLRTLIARSGSGGSASTWARYDALGTAYAGGGVNLAGQRLWLDNRYTVLAAGGLYALSYDAEFVADGAGRWALQHAGQDLLWGTASNTPLRIESFIAGSQLLTLGVATNGVTTEPWIEACTDLVGGHWSRVQSMSSWPSQTNGVYSTVVMNEWPSLAFLRAIQQGTNASKIVAGVPFVAAAGIDLGGVHRDTWPEGGSGEGGGGTNVYIYITTNLNIMTMTITNITIGGGGSGSFTNISINGIPNSSGVTIGDSINSRWTPGTDGVWRVDMATNQTQWVFNGEHVGGVDLDGITLLKGSLQLFEEDLNCNVRLYYGSRTSPSITFRGTTNEWGLYARGYNGTTVAGWSQAGTEIGLLHGGGIKLMFTNAAFEGRLIGDISQATGYPEHEFRGWQTNMSFTELTLSNMVVTPGSLSVKDSYMVSRSILGQTGYNYYDAGGVNRSSMGNDITIKNELGLTATKLEPSTLTFYDPASGIARNLSSISEYRMKSSAGQTLLTIDPNNGLNIYDLSSYSLRATVSSVGISIRDQASNVTFSITGTNGATTIRGQDSDARYVRVYTNWFSGALTNVFGGKTNVCRYQYGSLTNMTTL